MNIKNRLQSSWYVTDEFWSDFIADTWLKESVEESKLFFEASNQGLIHIGWNSEESSFSIMITKKGRIAGLSF